MPVPSGRRPKEAASSEAFPSTGAAAAKIAAQSDGEDDAASHAVHADSNAASKSAKGPRCSDNLPADFDGTQLTNTKTSRISALAARFSLQGDKRTLNLHDQIRKWDKDGDGMIDINEVLEGCHELLQEQNRSRMLRRMVVLAIVAGIVGCIAVFAITKAVVETSKETFASKGGTALVDGQGLVVSTAAAEAPLNLADLTRLPIEAFKQVNRLTFRTNSGEHFIQVAMASKTNSRLIITGQDGTRMFCTALQCEVLMQGTSQTAELVWVGSTPNGRRLQDHEHATVDLAFAGYNAPRYKQLVAAAIGDAGTLSLDRVIPSLKTDGCTTGRAALELAAACGLEPSTNAVLDPAAVCTELCSQGLYEVMGHCGTLAELVSSQGRRLAESDVDARTAAQLLRHIQRSKQACVSTATGGSEEIVNTEPAGQGEVSATWNTLEPTKLKLSQKGEPFLTQSIVGVRFTDDNGRNILGPLLFDSDNSYIDAKQTKNGDFLTVYSVLSLGNQSALRVIVSQVLAKSSQTLRTVQVGPTAACIGYIENDGTCNSKVLNAGSLKFSIFVEAVGARYTLPQQATRLSVILGLKPEISAKLSFLPSRNSENSGRPSLETMRLDRSDGSVAWSYRFEQSYNVDNQRTLDTVVVQPVSSSAADVAESVGQLLAVEMPVRADGALTSSGSFLMYDPETFSGNEKLSATDAATMTYDLLGITAAAFVYKKFNTTSQTGLRSLGWLLENSPFLKAGSWQSLGFQPGHLCYETCGSILPGSTMANVCCSRTSGGKFGAAYGRIGTVMHGLVSFAGTDDAFDAWDDLCAADTADTFTINGKEAAKGFWNSYNAMRPQFIQVLQDLRRLGVEKLIISGHSLGAAIASIATVDLPSIVDGYFAGDRHVRTVTLGEPPAWNWPNLAFGTTTYQTQQVSTQSCFLFKCSTTTITVTVPVYTPTADNKKIHRWVSAIKQPSTQCSLWERALASTGIFTCEEHDWDLVSGVPSLSGNGMHGSNTVFWLGFDATSKTDSEVINIYKDSQSLTNFRRTFSTADINLQFLFSAITAGCARRLGISNEIAPPEESLLPADRPRRLGLMTRLGAHYQGLYVYWAARGLCEEVGVGRTPCDCHVYCLAREQVVRDTRSCRLVPNPLSPCAASPVDSLCSDTFWKPDKCNCLSLIPDAETVTWCN